jgi:hypothetical protein
MKRKDIMYIFIMATFLLAFVSCVKTGTDAAKSAKVKQEQTVVHRTDNDSVVWANTDVFLKPLAPEEMDREWPGEKAGLVGPIVATGGTGSNAYLVVFDGTGALVGGVMKREAKKHPELFINLLVAADKRGQIRMNSQQSVNTENKQ